MVAYSKGTKGLLALLFNRFNRLLITALWVATLSACGGGGSNSQATAPDGAGDGGNSNGQSGEVIIGLTDAEGDFQTYIVDVVSLSLTRANGTEVETLPLTTRVDFAEYADLTEFLTAATVPLGAYTEVSMQLDFSKAEIFVEDELGNSVQVNPVDTNGDALGLVDVSVELHGRNRFIIAPGIPAHITLDFDLESSNVVDLNAAPPQVMVNPILITDFVLEAPKPHRLRGLLGEVSTAENAFAVFIRPFYHHGGSFGSIRVHVTNDTQYEVDETAFVGEDGLVALSMLDPRSPVVVFGGLNEQRQFVARDVLAGSSVPWGNQDWLQGSVVARSGDTITLSTVSRVKFDNEVDFFRRVTVMLADTTVVTKQDFVLDPVSIDDISVGQRVRIAGALNISSETPVLDASEGYVRMLLTNVAGKVVAPGLLAIDVQGFDGRLVSWFDFTGTGIDSAADADPNYYEINTGTLPLNNIAINNPVRIIGHVTPFASAPEDFDAQTVVNYSELPAKVLINWVPEPSTAAFIGISNTEIVVDMNDPLLGNLHKVIQAGIGFDLTSLGMDLTLAANTEGSGLFTIAGPQRVRVFDDFESFSAALSATMDGTKAVHGLHANGQFDAANVTLILRSLVVRIRNVN